MIMKRALPKDVLAGLQGCATWACDRLRRHETSVVLAAEGVPGNHLSDAGRDGAGALEVPEELRRASGGW